MSNKRRFLVLEDGNVFAGLAFGAENAASMGEVVFTTNMTGYLETLTDPSYKGQIIVQTFPLIGNYGANPQDAESQRSWPAGYIVKEWCQTPSHFACHGTLDTFLKEAGIPGLCGVDTRTLTRLLRNAGVLRGCLTNDPASTSVQSLQSFAIQNAVAQVTRQQAEHYPATQSPATGAPALHVVVYDFGVKQSTIARLTERGCNVTVVPAHTTATEALALQPNGILLSNGPGNPQENTAIIQEIAQLCHSGVALFGICLGHQLLALANGGQTHKLKYGHRGGNHPVQDLASGRTYITSQNHGYAVQTESLPAGATLRFLNANDATCEGLDYNSFNGFSVQFHPEARGGPRDTEFLFDRFVANITGGQAACR